MLIRKIIEAVFKSNVISSWEPFTEFLHWFCYWGKMHIPNELTIMRYMLKNLLVAFVYLTKKKRTKK